MNFPFTDKQPLTLLIMKSHFYKKAKYIGQKKQKTWT